MFSFPLIGYKLALAWKNLIFLYANIKGTDQPAQLCNLISAFAISSYASYTCYMQNIP